MLIVDSKYNARGPGRRTRLLRAGVVAAAGRVVSAVRAVVVVGALGAAAAADVADAGAQEGLRVGALVALRVEADLRAGVAAPGQPCLGCLQCTVSTCLLFLPSGPGSQAQAVHQAHASM